MYDHLMQEAPYEAWLNYFNRICARYEHSPKQVLDLACGTGTLLSH